MQVRQQKKDDRKKLSLLVLLLLVGALAVTGTIAWLTHSSKLDNCFTVGQISDIVNPDPDPDPDKPGELPDPGSEDADKILSGNIFEPNWEDQSKLKPGIEIVKDPYIGVGPKSEPCYVFVNISSNMNNNDHIYFKLEEGWKAVDAQSVPKKDGYYTGGTFRYTDNLDGSDKEKGNTWTKSPVFEKILVSEDANQEDFKKPNQGEKEETKPVIKVQSFLYQQYEDAEASKKKEIDVDKALEAAQEKFKEVIEKDNK